MADPQQDKLRATLTRALRTVETLREQVTAAQAAKSEPIAIVGIGLRLPGSVHDLSTLWHTLINGTDTISPVPEDRWPMAGYFDPEMSAPGTSYVREAGFLDDVSGFDAGFFGINPLEAEAMDPQQRLLLETAWEALETAGIVPEQLIGSRTGVFVGTTSHDYEYRLDPKHANTYSMIGIHAPFSSGRIAFHLGLRGPNVAVDTACSSSLVALHLACESLRAGESDLALAAGVQLLLDPQPFTLLCLTRALAPDGRSKTFSERADGYGRGEGVVVLACERLSDAVRNQREILAVVRGSAYNHDGASNGITAPSGVAQEEVIRQALKNARLEPHDVDFVECHGTGTRLGDPIEVQSLGAVYGAARADTPLLIGAIKPNIGHLESAAGLAGVAKVIAALRERQLPPTINSTPRNGFIDWTALNVAVVDAPQPWPDAARPSRGAVSSFGISGTNAHVILEAHPGRAQSPAPAPAGAWVFPLSGKSEAALRGQAARLRTYLADHPALSIADLAYSLAATRTHFIRRAAIVAHAKADLDAALEALASGTPHAARVEDRARTLDKVVFVFPGQGSQWAEMAVQLLDQSEAFRASIDACARALAPHVDWSLVGVLRQEPGAASLERVDVVQPVLFAMMVSLTAVWRELGVAPDLVIGHSQGEIAAAYVAGALSLEDAAKIVALRSRIIAQQLGEGGMAAVSMSADELLPWIAPYGERLSLAVDNGPASAVLSGDTDVIDDVVAKLEREGVFARKVRVTYASHGSHVAAIEHSLLEALVGVRPRRAQVEMISTVDVSRVEGSELDAAYWYRNLRQRVRFAEAVDDLLADHSCVFVEISPHPVLTLALEGIIGKSANQSAAVVGTLRRGVGNLESVQLSLAQIHCAGYPIDWAAIGAQRQPTWLSLPTYAFENQRYDAARIAPATAAKRSIRTSASDGHPLIGTSFQMSSSASTSFWEGSVSATAPAWLGDHRVEGTALFPGTGYAELVLSAARELSGSDSLIVEDLELRRAMILRAEDQTGVQVVLTEDGTNVWQAAVSEAAASAWQQLATARVSVGGELTTQDVPTLASLQSSHTRARPAADVYSFAVNNGLDYGPAFQAIESVWTGPDNAGVLAQLRLPEAAAAPDGYFIHPALLDACFHLTIATLLDDEVRGPSVPVLVERLQIARDIGRGPIWCMAAPFRPTRTPGRTVTELLLWNADGQLVGRVDGLHAEPVDRGRGADRFAKAFLELAWEPLEVPRASEKPGRWVVFADRQHFAERLQPALQARGAQVELITDVEPMDALAIAARLQGALRESVPVAGVACLWALDAQPMSELPADHILDAGRSGWAGVLHIVQSLISDQAQATPRLVVITCRAHDPDGTTLVRPEQALVWGLLGTVRSEQASLRPLLIDVPGVDEVDNLASTILSDTPEDQIALRGGVCHVARINRAISPSDKQYRTVTAEGSYRLEVDVPGSLDSLRLVGFEPGSLPPQDVEIEVEAAGINFRDVLLATGVVPPIGEDPRVRLGFECAGTISRVGSGVEGLHVGQRVLAITSDGFATHVVTKAQRIVPIPDSLGFAEAATLPVAQISAYYSLHHIAQLRAGEHVLIHSAAGGVGLAALQWAKHVGAKIHATAGSEAKRSWLREQGVESVSDSRSAAFVDEVLRSTDGQGVDVVLSALSGNLMRKSLGLLRPGGRFVDLSLRDALSNSQLAMHQFARGLTYALVNLGEMVLHSLPRVRAVLMEILGHVETGVLRPLEYVSHPLSSASDVFWEMARGQHIGKFVLRPKEPTPPPISVLIGAQRLSRTGSYLISGGLGGLGLHLARWMAERQAGHLLLLSRRGVTNDEQANAIAQLEAAGTRVTVGAVDIADLAGLRRLLDQLPRDRPLRGVVHAAGLLDDAMLSNQSVERFERVMSPKVVGAWNLHVLTKDLPDLDFFVMYSSAASLLGNPGQANYVAANAFLDALARHRRKSGLPALALGWGVFSGVGLAASEDIRGARLASRGVIALTPDDGVELFSRVVSTTSIHIAPCPIDTRRWLEFSPELARWPYYANLVAEVPAREQGGLLETLRTALPHERRTMLLDVVIGELAKVLRQDPKHLGPDVPFAELGVDSLMGVELRNRIQAETTVNLPSTTIWTYPSPAKLAEHLASALALEIHEPTIEAAPAEESSVAALDDDEIEAMLRAELGEL